jgi:hypothetical protein
MSWQEPDIDGDPVQELVLRLLDAAVGASYAVEQLGALATVRGGDDPTADADMRDAIAYLMTARASLLDNVNRIGHTAKGA